MTADAAVAESRDLVAALAEVAPGPAAGIEEAARLPAGASRQTWLLRRTDAPALVLRLNTPGSLDAPALLREAALMAAAGAHGVPSPDVLAHGTGPGPLAAGYVLMSHVEGESVPQRILRDPALAGFRDGFAAEAGRILARLHAIDPASLTGGDGPDLPRDDQLDAWTAILDTEPDPHPILGYVAAWLRRHRPAPVAPRLVHGDFRLGNVLVGADGVRAVLDWELAHLGDPVEDLAWLTIRAWRFGFPAEVAGCGDVADLVRAYEAAGGCPVEPDRLRWWQVMGCFRWGVICLHQAGRHLSGAERSVELAAIGRRAAEAEYDAMLLLTA
ncbi:phosphotransferase family protein [Nocardioides sp. GY 10113]|uniref:phosphotransferase family protein n=1 Tax=Nocardioides sp. GY 10113 TaxID=2569761 RepID=UPI0010A8C000|nr:phosphotransferase family protein [Nocardioides sp. GY 10113]TIC86793.1 phosphotransferase family protein [Nocardioides sp. GY 10113]